MPTTCQNFKILTAAFGLPSISQAHLTSQETLDQEYITKINSFFKTFEKAHDEWFVDYQEQVKENLSDWYPAKNNKFSFIKSLSIDPDDYRVIVGGDIDLSNIRKLDVFPTLIKKVTGNLNLDSLTTADGLVLPNEVDSLHLTSLTTADGLVLPDKVKFLFFSSLTTADGLVLPNEVYYLYLSSLTTAKGVKFPDKVDSLHLTSLTTAEGLVLPNEVELILNLSSLTTAKGVKFPDKVGTLILSSLTTADDLVLSDSLNILKLSSRLFTKKDQDNIKNKYPKVQIDFL